MLRSIATVLKLILLGLVFGPLLLVAYHNRQPVGISLKPLPYEMQVPLFMIAVLAFAAGIVCCGITLHLKHIKLHRSGARLRKRTEALENEIALMKHKTRQQPVVPAP